jgi:diguanylate cyclase (GGDEF)-like protein
MEENPFHYKIFLIAATVILAIFGILDVMYLQEPWRAEILKLTFLGIGPFIVLSTLIYLYNKTSWLCPLSIFLTLLAAALISVRLVMLAEKADIGQFYPSLILIVLFSFFLSGLHYMLAIAVSFTLLIAYYTANFEYFTSLHTPPPEIVFLSLCIFVSLIGSISLERSHKKRYQQSVLLSYYADRDSLTGLFNRRYFFNFAEKVWKQCLRDKLPITIMIADVDYFKKYNDSYGHIQGDHCLRALSRTFELAMKRPFDLVARYGGEEFIFLWFNTESDYIKKVIEVIRTDVMALKIDHNDSSINEYVTISGGISTCIPNSETSIYDLVQTADTALYKAKTQGRNRCVFS